MSLLDDSHSLDFSNVKPRRWYSKLMDWFFDKYQWTWWYRKWCSLKYRYIKKYNTVIPRSLPKDDWVDRRELLVHVMFEVLQQFVEKECSPGFVDWKRSNHTIVVDGEDENVRDVMDDVLAFWDRYIRGMGSYHDDWHIFRELHAENYTSPFPDNPEWVTWKTKWDSEENEKEGDRLFEEANQKERDLEKELHDNMILICKLQPFLWT